LPTLLFGLANGTLSFYFGDVYIYSVSFSKKSDVRSTILGGLFILKDKGAAIRYFLRKSSGFPKRLLDSLLLELTLILSADSESLAPIYEEWWLKTGKESYLFLKLGNIKSSDVS